MGIRFFAIVQIKFELENRKEKHFLGVSYCNLQVFSLLHCDHTRYSVIENKLENFRKNLLQTKPRISLVPSIWKNGHLHTLPCI